MRWKKHEPEGEPMLVKKHPLAIRWFHWINFPVLSLMVWSGMLIFWANRGGALDDKGNTILDNHGGAVTRFGHPMFPEWFYNPPVPNWFPKWIPTFGDDAPHRTFWDLHARLAEGMAWHFTLMWVFALNGLVYVLYLLKSGEWRTIFPKLKSFKNAVLVALADFKIVKEPKHEGTYNDAQKVAYTAVILMGLVMLLSGFAIYKPTQAFWLTAIFGGYRMARWFHFWTTMGLVAFFGVHVAQVIRAGWNNFRSMVTGYALEYAHPKPIPEPEFEPEPVPEPTPVGVA